MNRRQSTSLALSGALLATCASSEAVGVTASDLRFPSVVPAMMYEENCTTSPAAVLVHYDSEPDKRDDIPVMMGVYEVMTAEGLPEYVAGVTIRKMGALAYELTTSEDAIGQSLVINLTEQNYATTLNGGESYDTTFSMRLNESGNEASFWLSCLSDSTSFMSPAPLEELLPDLPHEEYPEELSPLPPDDFQNEPPLEHEVIQVSKHL